MTANTRDNQMAGGKHKNRSNRNQDYLISSETNSPTIGSPGYTITPEKQDLDLKSLLMMMMEDIKKEIQENTAKQLEVSKEETQKCLRELQGDNTKQEMELNNSLKEIQENTGKQLEALKEETQKSLKELQENTIKQVKELNKTIQDLKMEVETIKKS